jgi:hypothetical protein
MQPKRIKTLAELQDKRINLKIRMAATRKELLRSATETATSGRQFLFKKVMLPAGAAALGIAATRNVLHATGHDRPKRQKASHGLSHWSKELLLMGLPVLQQVLSQAIANWREEEEDDGYEAMYASSLHEKESGPDWVQMLLPIGISLLRNFIESKMTQDGEPEFYS